MSIIKNISEWWKNFKTELPYNLHNSWIGQKYHNIRILIRDLIFPNNVIKIERLDRHWHDYDEILFHVMFQVLCNFIEKEKPFVSFDDPDYYTNKKPSIKKMRKFLQKALDQTTDAHKQYISKLEILKLYEWYTIIYPNRPYYIHNTINKYVFGKNGIQTIKNTNKHDHFITIDEFNEIEKEYELFDNIMMRKLLYYRKWL